MGERAKKAEHGTVIDAILAHKIMKVVEIIEQYGGIEGDHHRAWVLDQVVRTITDEYYEDWVKSYNQGEEGPNSYAWDKGIAP